MDRRTILKTMGAGTGAALFSGSASARADGEGRLAIQDQCQKPDCIHPVLGFVGLSTNENPPVQPDHEVELQIEPREGEVFPEYFFEPTGLLVESGDVVRFSLPTPGHTVTAYHPSLGRQRRVPEGVEPFSSPLLGIDMYWFYQFDEPGVYDLFCGPYEIFGMVMRIVVGEPMVDFDEDGEGGGGESDEGEEERRPPAFTAATVLEDPALGPEQIAEAESVSWADLAEESKRLQVVPREEVGEGAETPTETGTPEEGDGEVVEVAVGPDLRLRFDPETVEISVGDTVRWTFESEGHNVSSKPGGSEKVQNPPDAEPFASYEGDDHFSLEEPGTTYEHTFTVPGEYVYVCVPHADQGMIGTVIVNEE